MEINQMLKRQEHFFQSQKTKKYEFRKKALLRLECAIKQHEEDMEHALYKDLGKSSFESYMAEIGMVKSELSYAKKHLKKWMKTEQVKTPLAQFPSQSYKIKEPLGKVLIIAPWNYPILLSLQPLIGAIAAGNCCVLKLSEHAPHCASLLKKMIGEVFPSHYVAVINGGVEISEKLLEQSFDHIFYTGGERVGKIVMEKASRHLTPVTLELGGKSPCIVEESANIKLAAKRIVFGKFLNSGQTCVAPDYIFVDKKAESELIFYLKYWINKMIGEHPLSNKDYSSMINPRHYQRIMELMKHEKIVEGGYGDIRLRKIAPTILVNVKEESTVMQEEIFGPLLPIMTYDKLEDAVSYIRDHNKPLALYDTIIHLATPYLGFGGVGNSGMGSYHGKKSFDIFTHEKSIIKKSDKIDIPVRYMPYNKAKEQLMKFFLKLYGKGAAFMEFTNVLPGVKLVKQDEAGNEEELFVSQNDHVIVKTLNGREIKGIFMQIEFARCLEEDDIVHVHKDNGENEGIPFDTIDDIIKG